MTEQKLNSVENNPCFNDVSAKPTQNSKTVECQLKLTYQKLAETEANIYLFTKLKSLNLATNDVTNFILKQTIHSLT